MTAITGLDETAFRQRTNAGDWTPVEVLAHLLAAERTSLERVRTVLTQDNPSVAWIPDDELEQQARSAQRMPVPQIVHGLLAQRRDVLLLLESLTPEQLSRPYQHERRGEHTAGWLFHRMAEHEREHAGQIRQRRGSEGPGS
jgi:hypothetical protein